MRSLKRKALMFLRANYRYWLLIVISGLVVLHYRRIFLKQSDDVITISSNQVDFVVNKPVVNGGENKSDSQFEKFKASIPAKTVAKDTQFLRQDVHSNYSEQNVNSPANNSASIVVLNKQQSCSNVKYQKPSTSIPDSQTWYHVANRKVMIFSAFYESRQKASGPSIRILGAGFQKAYNKIGNLYCQLWYEGSITPVSVLADYQVIYKSVMHHDMWCSHFLICKLEDTVTIPYAVSVTPDKCSQPTHSIKILNRNQKALPKSNISVRNATFSVCLSALYNKYKNWQFIIEMFELYRILGASEITIYNLSVDEITNKVLNYYARDPSFKVNVIKWKIVDKGYLKSFLFLQRAALNDCLYRMSSQHHFVAVHDIDEILMPRTSSNWPQFFTDNEIYKPNIGVYMFQHYYFRKNKTSSKQPYFVTQQSLWRTDKPQPAGNIRCKSIYNAKKTVRIDVHYHYELLGDAKPYILPAEYGSLHHYRSSPMESFIKKPENYHFIEDKHMQRYSELLQKSYVERLLDICKKDQALCKDLT